MLSSRRAASVVAAAIVAALTCGCTSATKLRDPKSGQTVTCGGEMWNPQSSRVDQHCLDYWHGLGYRIVP